MKRKINVSEKIGFFIGRCFRVVLNLFVGLLGFALLVDKAPEITQYLRAILMVSMLIYLKVSQRK